MVSRGCASAYDLRLEARASDTTCDEDNNEVVRVVHQAELRGRAQGEPSDSGAVLPSVSFTSLVSHR